MKKHWFSSARRSRACRNSPRKWLSPPSAWMGSMMIAAMSSGWSAKALADLRQRALLGLEGGGQRLGREREAQLGVLDPRPVELGEQVDLARVGVGQRHGVARAAVEGLAEVDHLAAPVALEAARPVAPHLPVEGRLEGVLVGQRAALDEEQVAHVLGLADARQRVHEPGVLDAVEVGERGLEAGHPGQDAQELGLAQGRVVVADGVRAEEGQEVEELAPAAGVVHPGAVALLDVEHQVEAVGQDVAGQVGVHVTGCHGGERRGAHGNGSSHGKTLKDSKLACRSETRSPASGRNLSM